MVLKKLDVDSDAKRKAILPEVVVGRLTEPQSRTNSLGPSIGSLRMGSLSWGLRAYGKLCPTPIFVDQAVARYVLNLSAKDRVVVINRYVSSDHLT